LLLNEKNSLCHTPEYAMPLTHVRTFRVRHYECNAHDQVFPAVYMRYAQEAAFDATAAAGFDLARYEELDRLWLARDSEIDYLHPLRYGDSVQVKTWVVDFRRVRSIRAYEFRHAESGIMVARATTDWVHLVLSTGRPAYISPEMRAAFYPEGPPAPAPARERFPVSPAPPSGAFKQTRRAEWRDVDAAGHVNNTVYLSYVEECALQALAARGWPLSRTNSEGFAIVAKSHRIEYRQPALPEDELELTTWLSDIQDTTAIRHTTVTRTSDRAQVSRARTVHAWVDLETGKPVAIPDALLADVTPAIAVQYAYQEKDEP
jgi:acyl-CoA thioester hydrolase